MFTDTETNIKCENDISRTVLVQGFLFYCTITEMLSTWPYTALVENYFLTKLGRKEWGQESCPRAK